MKGEKEKPEMEEAEEKPKEKEWVFPYYAYITGIDAEGRVREKDDEGNWI